MNIKSAQPLLLIVDDEPMNLALLERLFAREYQVVAVTSGAQALDMLAQAPFDCMLLDIMMPGTSGLDVLEKVRACSATADLPVILVSALADRQDVVRGLKMGANDYVTKPIEMEVLLARVQTQVKLKQLQDQRKQAIEELETAHEMKDRILRIASHDLKSPLANIGMIKFLLREQLADDEAALSLIGMLDGAAEHMLAVIRDFLETAAMKSGEVDLTMVDVPLQEVVRDICDQYRLIAEKKRITLDIGNLDTMVHIDPLRVSQVVDNLVSNAIKYSAAETTVTIEVEASGMFTRLSIIDQGPGISAEERSRLFTEFGRTSNRPTGGESSTGLGLWIVKHLVSLHGGAVGCDPAPDGGSIFWIELPLAIESAEVALTMS